jgi:hypothetical protein
MVHGNTPLRLFGILLCVLLVSLGFSFSSMARQEIPKGTTAPNDSMRKAFHARTVSLINERCAGCHGGKHPRMGLNLEPKMLVPSLKDVPSRQIDSLKLVDTRKPERSYFLMKVRGDKGIKGSRMPDNAPAFSADEIRMIDRWIHGISGFRYGPKPVHSAQDSTRKQ